MNQPPSTPQGTRHLVAPELLSALNAFPSFDINLETIAELRKGGVRRDGLTPPLSPAQQAVHCEQRYLPGPKGAPEVRVLIYRPPGPAANARPVYLHMHGGGYVLGTAELNDGSNRQLANDLGCVVVSIDYRLAPETPF